MRNIVTSIVSVPGKIVDSIVNLGKDLVNLSASMVNALLTGLKELFIPSPDYFSKTFTRLKDKFSAKLGFKTYLQLFDSLKSQVSNAPTFGGYIDTSMWVPYLGQIHAYIKGFFYCLMIIFNIKQIIWMVRGSAPINGGGKSS